MSALLRVVAGLSVFALAVCVVPYCVAQEESASGHSPFERPADVGEFGTDGDPFVEGRGVERRDTTPDEPPVVRYWIDWGHGARERIKRRYEGVALSSSGFDFEETPLDEVVEFLRDEYKLPLQFDLIALDELGISPDEKVTCNLRNIQLADAMRLILDPLELTVMPGNGVLLITSQEEALTRTLVAVYPVGDLLGEKSMDYDSLIQAIVSNVATDSWIVNGGSEAMISPFPNRGALVISQTDAVHDDIAGLLTALRKCEAYDATVKAPENAGRRGGRGGFDGGRRGGFEGGF